MKILERIVDGLIRQVVSIADLQSGFVPGRDITHAILVVRQLQKKYKAFIWPSWTQKIALEKLSVGGRRELVVTTHVKTAWKKF